jgi:hypothetical protein
MPSAGFEHTIPAGERPQTDALDRAATGTGCDNVRVYIIAFESSHTEFRELQRTPDDDDDDDDLYRSKPAVLK